MYHENIVKTVTNNTNKTIQEGDVVDSENNIVATADWPSFFGTPSFSHYITHEAPPEPEFDQEKLLDILSDLEHAKYFTAYDDDPFTWPYIMATDTESLERDVELLRRFIKKFSK
jgi:hypothetical protein